MYICLDMDGTIASLYSVDNWLEKLRAENPEPYLKAKPLCNMRKLAHELNRLEKTGNKVTIISWLSKFSSASYDKSVRFAKRRWLNAHLGSVDFSSIHIVKYGTPKHNIVSPRGNILIDDEEKNRTFWEKHGGVAINPQTTDICEYLSNL